MSDTCTTMSIPRKAARPVMGSGVADMASRHLGLATLRTRLSAWREQAYFRWQLKQMALGNPHLIDDIGLTRQQAEAEIAKLPFWQR